MSDRGPSRPRYHERMHAGYDLASELQRFIQPDSSVVLAIPHGGVPVAGAICTQLGTRLDLVVTRRIEAPGRPGLTLGAITPDRTLVVNKTLQAELGLSDLEIEEMSIPAWAEAQRSQQLYRAGRPQPNLRGQTAVIVDDRLITGYSVMAAVVSVRKQEPDRIVVAVPVSYIEGLERARGYAEELLSLEVATDPDFNVSRYYARYPTITDQEVIWTLKHFWAERPPQGYSETF